MRMSISASILLCGPHESRLKELSKIISVEWARNMAEIKQRLNESCYPVVVLFPEKEESPFPEHFTSQLDQESSLTKFILLRKNLLSSNLCSWINCFRPHALLESYDDPRFQSCLFRSLEDYHLTRQNRTLLQLIQEEYLQKKANNLEIESKKFRRQQSLERARERLKENQQQMENMQKAILAIYRANSLHEMEKFLVAALSQHLHLQEIRILLEDRVSPHQEELQQKPSKENTFTTPIYSNNLQIGQIHFTRSSPFRSFGNKEISFCKQVAEAVSLAMDRLRAYEQASHLKAQWEATFDAIAEPLCITDVQFNLLRMNQSFVLASKKTAKDLIGKNCFQAIAHQSTPKQILEGKRELRLRIPNNEQIESRTLELHVHPLNLKPTDNKAFLLIFRDLTDQLRLERQVLETTKMVELGIISSSIAHELNNPLGGILSFLQLILMDIEKDSELASDIFAMEEAARRCKEIVENLLGFARQEQATKKSILDLRELTVQVLNILKIQTRSRGIKIDIIQPSVPLYVEGHDLQLSQAIRHILQNSIEAVSERMDQNPGYLGKIKIVLNEVEDEIHLDITDNGSGIANIDRQKIFNPLYSTKSSDKNYGLGLTIAFKIISEHKGRLEISTQLGVGTLAKIALKRPDLKGRSQVFDSKI